MIGEAGLEENESDFYWFLWRHTSESALKINEKNSVVYVWQIQLIW